MSVKNNDTIFAQASAPGRAGVAVMRVSGPLAWRSLAVLAGDKAPPPAREARLSILKNPADGSLIDRALVIGFRAPASYTGEDTVEYHLHGGRAVVESFLSAMAAQPGHRLAQPGEFTRRAFENSKMDLTEAEAVADLINAETALQKAQALQQMGGGLAEIYQAWAERLKNALAYIEAEIEFPDEDLPADSFRGILPTLEKLVQEILVHLQDNRRGERLRDGLRVAIIGAPNAGKSSLLNALSQRDVAIVSDVPGTTRDALEVHLDLGGYPFTLIDTAGLREQTGEAGGHDAIEAEGIRRARARAQEADILILLFDGTRAADQATLAQRDDRALLVSNKGDLPLGHDLPLDETIQISARSQEGLPALLRALQDRAREIIGDERNVTEAAVITRARHREALQEGVTCLRRALQAPLPELLAEDVRLAMRSLGRITGRVDVEDLLDKIFGDFCIGK